MGHSVPVCRLDLIVLLVPVHKVMFSCELFQEEAELVVHPDLPVPAVTVIL